MNDKETILSRSKEARLLNARIAENVAGQEIDLVEWIFNRIAVGQGTHVLELCCGTGAQTLKLLDLVGGSGQVTAVDTSREAREASVKKVLAHIKEENKASIGAFKKAGFVDRGVHYFKGHKAIEMVWEAGENP